MNDKMFFFPDIVDLSEIGYWIIDLRDGAVDASSYFWTILGYNKGDLEETLDNLKKIHHQNDWANGWELISKLINKEISIYENKIRYLKKDGSWLWCEVKGKISEWDENGNAITFIGFIRDISLELEYIRLVSEKSEECSDLDRANDKIKELRGIIPICSKCKSIRNDEGYWKSVEVYIENNTEIVFTHGLCEKCCEKLYKDEGWFERYKSNLSKK